MFPPIHVSLAGKCSWQTESKAEFVVTVAGRGKRGFVWSPDNILLLKKKNQETPLEHTEQNLMLRYTGLYT